MCFEEGVDSVEAFDHVLDDQEIFALEVAPWIFNRTKKGLISSAASAGTGNSLR